MALSFRLAVKDRFDLVHADLVVSQLVCANFELVLVMGSDTLNHLVEERRVTRGRQGLITHCTQEHGRRLIVGLLLRLESMKLLVLPIEVSFSRLMTAHLPKTVLLLLRIHIHTLSLFLQLKLLLKT